MSISYIRSQFGNFLYSRDLSSGKVVFLLLYVDDMSIVSLNIDVTENG